MQKPEANKFLLTRIRVLEATATALLENKTFSSVGDWEAHAAVESMRATLPAWRKSLEKSLRGPAPEPEVSPEEVLSRIERLARTLVDQTIGDPDQILSAFEEGLETISDTARNAVIELRKRYGRSDSN